MESSEHTSISLDLMDLTQSLPSGMHINVGDPSRGVSAFALCRTEKLSVTTDQLADLFSANAMRFTSAPN